MGKKFPNIEDKQIEFIKAQQMFFVATATDDSRINLSPKGLDSLRILGKNRVLWLNLTGSGNETAAHLQTDTRMTMMFCAFDGPPLILRLYGQARMVLTSDDEWAELYAHFNPLPGARQIFDVTVDLVHTSCGFGVPLYDFAGERPLLNRWAEKKGEDGIRTYWHDKNSISLDGAAIPIGDDD